MTGYNFMWHFMFNAEVKQAGYIKALEIYSARISCTFNYKVCIFEVYFKINYIHKLILGMK